MATSPLGAGAREAEDAVWTELSGKGGIPINVSPVHRLRISGNPPPGLAALPKDNRPANRHRGEQIMAGKWRFGHSTVDTPARHAPWGPAFPSLHFADRIHRFHWLRDVASLGPDGEAHARALVVGWVDMFGKWENFAWRHSIAAERLVNFLCAGPWLLGALQGDARTALLDTIGRHMRHLHVSLPEEADPQTRFKMTVGMCLAGAAADDKKILEAGLAALETECGAQILADGGHASRSPEALAEAMLDIQSVEELLLRLGLNAPAFLTKLQPRMAAMLSFFQLPDGGVLTANGGGDCVSGLARAALRPHTALTSRFSFARLSAYQRIQAEDLTVYVDAGPGPERPHGGRAHAGALAITVDDGPERLVTSCGANPDLELALQDASRRTAAHSVLSLNGEDSAVFTPDPATGLRAPEGPAQLSIRRLEEGDQILLEGQHGGWRVRHGLIYRRRLYVAKNGARITGEDSLSRPMSETALAMSNALIPFEIRFHLHPDVQVVDGPDDRTVFLGLSRRQRVWRFRSETLLSVENSRYWGSEAARKTRQLVIRGVADPAADGTQAPNRVRWALSRIEPGVQGEAA
ncbi:MAG TPA: heparinase II/III family protein [Hyphomonadaceae bacterium]|nr:heparinase II/III family protein [Hyphomonadaceae bacterium]